MDSPLFVHVGVGVIAEPDRLYNAMHGYLSSCGVDGVKVDCQAGLGLVGSSLGGGAAVAKKWVCGLAGRGGRREGREYGKGGGRGGNGGEGTEGMEGTEGTEGRKGGERRRAGGERRGTM